MKKFIYILAASMALVLFAGEANAQMGKRNYINGGWQFNGTPGNTFAKSAQGYGAYIEGGYYLTPLFAVGGFASFNSNNEYHPKETYTFANQAALTTDLDRSLYQVPFGATMRMRFTRGMFQPYVEAKIGTEYSTQSTYMSTFVSRQDNWGFYISPEVGMTFFPFEKTDFGFHVAAYYSYATNQNKSYDLKGINNLGFKLGIAF
ncbi:MAG: outer membrane beta-barrel protein [Bacteroidales bacterium]|nr:outer membrane beta-barrel protein [Bacteroidales bacterium]MBR2855900.1 outer membrane beta-barrel protein [Bacteroidales bacterium]